MSFFAETVVARSGANEVLLPELLQMLHQEGSLVSALHRAMVRQVIRQHADELGLIISDEQMQDAADEFRRRHGLLTSDEMNQWLRTKHLSLLDFQSVIEQQLIRQFVYTVMTSSAETHFDSNRSAWDKLRFREIVFHTEHMAEELKCQHLEDGLELAQLLLHFSGSSPEKHPPDIRTCFRDALPDWSKDSLIQASSSSLIGPLVCPAGWALIFVEAVTAAVFDQETEAAIRDHLFQQWLSARIRESKISYPLLDLLSCQNDS